MKTDYNNLMKKIQQYEDDYNEKILRSSSNLSNFDNFIPTMPQFLKFWF